MTLESNARQFAEAWLRLVAAGELEQADQLRLPSHDRMPSATAREEFYRQHPSALTDLTNYFATPVMRDFIALGENVKFRFDSLERVESHTYLDRLTLRYEFGDAEEGTAPRPLAITVVRQQHEDHLDWQIEVVSDRFRP